MVGFTSLPPLDLVTTTAKELIDSSESLETLGRFLGVLPTLLLCELDASSSLSLSSSNRFGLDLSVIVNPSASDRQALRIDLVSITFMEEVSLNGVADLEEGTMLPSSSSDSRALEYLPTLDGDSMLALGVASFSVGTVLASLSSVLLVAWIPSLWQDPRNSRM